VVLEAMATGIPAIAADWGGPADYIDGSCGILVPVTSRDAFVAQLAAALTRLAAFPAQRLTMGRAAVARAVQHFDWEIKVDRMLGLYRSVTHASPETTETAHASTRQSVNESP
jgi:glycosyltransferase involved in cell wall biosynthesis